MYQTDSLLDYLNTPDGIKNIILAIILVGAINIIFIGYSVRSRFSMAKRENKQRKMQQEKINRLSPNKP